MFVYVCIICLYMFVYVCIICIYTLDSKICNHSSPFAPFAFGHSDEACRRTFAAGTLGASQNGVALGQ